MRHELAQARLATCLLGGSLILTAAPIGVAVAFPLIDPTNQGSVVGGAPLGTDLPAADAAGLKSHLHIANPNAPGTGAGWTFIPRLTLQEQFTDNAYEVKSPRRFDAATVFAPGIAISADTSRVQLKLDYQANVLMHAINGDLNALTHQLNASGIVTVVPELAYIDVRAVSGTQSRIGGLSGLGGIGSSGDFGTASASGPATNGAGLNRFNEVQTTSFGVSPYLLRKFGDYGTAKLGVSADVSSSTPVSGFAANPFSTGGAGSQTLLTTEQIAQFTTGESLGRFQDSLSIDVSQSRSQFNSGTPGSPNSSFTSQRQTVNNQMSYALDRTFTALASIGDEQITYSSNVAAPIRGITWSVGMTITPNQDSSLTVKYGHQNGSTSVTANGYYAVTARTLLSFDYSTGVGTQLENLQNQLNNNAIAANGQSINPQTGGPNFVSTNAAGAQTGVYRFQTLNMSARTAWERDTVQATLSWSVQTNLSPGGTSGSTFLDPLTGNVIVLSSPTAGTNRTTDYKTASLQWTHELTPDLTMSSSAAYSLIRRGGGLGNDGALSIALGLRYVLSESLTANARYSFFDRISRIPGYTLYENSLLLGVTKQF